MRKEQLSERNRLQRPGYRLCSQRTRVCGILLFLKGMNGYESRGNDRLRMEENSLRLPVGRTSLL